MTSDQVARIDAAAKALLAISRPSNSDWDEWTEDGHERWRAEATVILDAADAVTNRTSERDELVGHIQSCESFTPIPEGAVDAALKAAYPIILENLTLPYGASVRDYPNHEDLKAADYAAEQANTVILKDILRAALEAAGPYIQNA